MTITWLLTVHVSLLKNEMDEMAVVLAKKQGNATSSVTTNIPNQAVALSG